MRQMAADTAGLLDALAIDRAALLGISMGGMIAQEFALNYPERLSALVLDCTNFGGPDVVQADPEIISAVMAGTKATPAQRRIQLRASFSDFTIDGRPEFLARDEEMRAL
jgi:pimeloyl-ACP methyl ester carboxylesterase